MSFKDLLKCYCYHEAFSYLSSSQNPSHLCVTEAPKPHCSCGPCYFLLCVVGLCESFSPCWREDRVECPGSSHFGCLAPNITCASYTCSLTSLRKEPHKLELVASSSYSVLHGLVLQSYPINAWASFCYSWVFFGGFCRYRSTSLMGTYRQTQYNSFNLLLFNRVLKMLFCPREFSRAAGAGVGV